MALKRQHAPLSSDLDDPSAVPYFLWDEPMTVAELRARLRTASPPKRTRLLAKILSEARDTDVWRFTSPGPLADTVEFVHHGVRFLSGGVMALNIKDPVTERLASEVASITGESKTRAIRKALEERKERLAYQVHRREKGAELRHFLEEEVWPQLPRSVRGRRLSRKEEDAILGYGKKGV